MLYAKLRQPVAQAGRSEMRKPHPEIDADALIGERSYFGTKELVLRFIVHRKIIWNMPYQSTIKHRCRCFVGEQWIPLQLRQVRAKTEDHHSQFCVAEIFLGRGDRHTFF